ncbi:uncharacterized protein [Clytia hemisphaerica]|uniref:PA14 domain-containing protein n=1 Tax=Clytia hemisphaerica TaxID=252671 RepID=A0A7M5X2Y1_9CNID|eukprot:TCONS_00007380-protein
MIEEQCVTVLCICFLLFIRPRDVLTKDLILRGEDREAYWELAYDQKVLDRTPIIEVKVNGDFACLQACLQTPECRSVNYEANYSRQRCQLLKYNRLNAPVYKDAPNPYWKHFDTGLSQFVRIKMHRDNACYVTTCSGNKEAVLSEKDQSKCQEFTDENTFEYDMVSGTIKSHCTDNYLCPQYPHTKWMTVMSGDHPCKYDDKYKFRRAFYGAIMWGEWCLFPENYGVSISGQLLQIGLCTEAASRITFEHQAKPPVKVSFYKTSTNSRSSLDAAIQNTAKYPNTPDWIGYGDTFVFNDWNDYYMLRLQANFLAPENGEYKFYVSCDSYAKLYLSTGKDEGNKQEIAHCLSWVSGWDWSIAYVSQAVTLTAEHLYYMEVVFYEDGGGDRLQVGMKLPGSSTIQMVEAYHLQLIASEMEA